MVDEKQARAIRDAIRSYAQAYRAIQHWQEQSPLIPIGDQKTGCIGEFYVYLYLASRFPDAHLAYGGHSEKGWDIRVTRAGEPDVKVQVKTVSAFSTTRTISPIHHGWDELHVVYLDKGLEPEGFWIVRDAGIVEREKPLTSRKCPTPGKMGTGSKGIAFGDNLIEELRECIGGMLARQER